MVDRIDVEALGRAIASAQDAASDECRARSDEHLRQRISSVAVRGQRTFRMGPLRWGLLGTGVAALVVAHLAGALSLSRNRPVSFTVGDDLIAGHVGESLYVPTDHPRPLLVRFSEGSTVSLQPATRGRVASVGPGGADIELESGRAEFKVVHRSNTKWTVRAGEFAVRVTGTRFQTDYDRKANRLTVAVTEGSVVVSGCGSAHGRVLRANERFVESCSRPVRDVEAATTRGTAPTDGPGTAPTLAPSQPPAGSSNRSWMRLAKSGRYTDAYEAVRSDFDRACRTLGPLDLWLLSDVARLAGRPAEAGRAYTSLRNRFPTSAPAADAAFALGRLAEDQGDTLAAERWFDAYVRQRPDGPLSRPAYGRILELRLARGDRAGALAAASEYLRRYPAGPLATQARDLLSSGTTPSGTASSGTAKRPIGSGP